jgi:sec-independent protein translocase protein TatB
MFDLGFSEIIFIAIIALLFIGPDKLPETMRNVARGLGKLKRVLTDAKSTITTELQVDQLKEELMHYRSELEKTKSDLSAFKNIAAQEANEIKKEVNEVKQNIEHSFEGKNLNDDYDSLLDDELEKAEKEFEALEKEELKKENKSNTVQKDNTLEFKQQELATTKKEQVDPYASVYAQAPTEPQNLDDYYEKNKLSGFKNIKKGS